VAEAAAARVGPIVAVSMGPRDGARVLELRRRHPGLVRAGVGLHPSRVPEIGDEEAAAELALVAARAAEADVVGEIGLDYRDARDAGQQRRQREVLERLLDVAERARKPVNLHTRRADRDLLEAAAAFTRRTGLPALLHWFTHSRKLARRCGQAGIHISAGPSIEIDPGQAEVARAIDPDFLLVETDSPVVYAGRAARPAWAARVAEALARARKEDPDALRERLAANLERYLGAGRPRGGPDPASR
jgi:TatD DNase family protein